MEKFLITVLIGTAGGLIGYHLKLPAGTMIGAMVFVAVYNILSNQAYFPKNGIILLQIAAGIMIGTRVTRETVTGLKDILIPAVIIVFGVVIINFTIGLLITKFSNLDLATSLFSSAPGGLTEMTLASSAMGADTPKVATLQLLRLISVITFLPILLRVFINHFNN